MAIETLTCPYCGRQHLNRSNFCPETGKPIPHCPDCGFLLEDSPEICPNCGFALDGSVRVVTPPPAPVEQSPKPVQAATIAPTPLPFPPPPVLDAHPLQPDTEVLLQPPAIPATEQLLFPATEALPLDQTTASGPGAVFPPWIKTCSIILASFLGLAVVAGLAFVGFRMFQDGFSSSAVIKTSTRAAKTARPSLAAVASPTSDQAPALTPSPGSMWPPTIAAPSQAPPSTTFSWAVQTVDKNPEVGAFSSLAIDPQDGLHIAYYDDRMDDLRLAENVGNSWKYKALIGKEKDGFYASLALDSSGIPYVAFYVYDQNIIKVVTIVNNNWRALPPLAPFKFEATNLSMAMDREDKPHLIFSDKRKLNILYATLNNNQWNTQFVSDLKSEDNKSDKFPLVLDQSGQPRTCFYNKNTGLNYASLSGGAWKVENVDPNPGAGTYPSLKMDSKDYPHIAYYDQLNHTLKHAYWNGEKWMIETVDSGGDVGMYPSIALDKSNFIHISYYDAGNSALKYAFWNGSRWSIATVDDEGDVGMFNSLALDRNGEPRISYYDATNKWLKLASATKD